MPQTVDERIVEMRIDKDQFERGAQQVMRTMDKLRESTNFGSFGVDDLDSKFEKLSNSFEKTTNGFLSTWKRKFWDHIQNDIEALPRKFAEVFGKLEKQVEELSIGQMDAGWGKLEEKTASVQTLLNSTGLTLEQVNQHLADLMWYSDETSFGFTDMTQALATMTSTGGDIEKLIPMIMGMGNAVAFAGKSASEFKRVIFNLNQSYSSGALTLLDWRSVQQAGAASKQLTQAIIDAGVALGTIEEGMVTVNNFADSLKDKWATSEVLEKAFGYFGEMSVQARKLVEEGAFDTAYEAYDYLAEKFDDIQVSAAKAAQEAKSFGEAIDATKDAVSTGWMNIFETIFGDYDQQKSFWSDVTEELYQIFTGPINRIQDWADVAFGDGAAKKVEEVSSQMTEGWVKLQNRVESTGHSIEEFITILEDVYGYHNGAIFSDLIDNYGSIEEVFRSGEISAEDLSLALSLLEKESYALGDTSGTKILSLAKEGLLVGDQLQDALAALPFFDSSASYPGFDALIEEFREGQITAEEFLGALNAIEPTFDHSFQGSSAPVEQMKHSLEELKEVALGLIRGDYGDGQNRRDILESMGYNYDLVQGLAEIMYNGGQGMIGITEQLLETEYPTFYAMLQSQVEATYAYADSIDELTLNYQEAEDILASFSVTTREAVDAQEEEAKSLAKLPQNMKAWLQDAEDELTQIQEEIAEKGIDINKTVYGNIDTNNRQILEWTEENLEKYGKALESWGIKAEEVAGDISTVLGGSEEFRGIEIAYSPILQTENGPELLSHETVSTYINGLLDAIEQSGKEATPELLLELDTKGFEIDGRIVKGLLADIGDTAIQTGEAMHYVGANGALEQAKQNLEDVRQAAKEFLEMSGGKHLEAGLVNVLSFIKDVLNAIYAGFDKVFGTVEKRGSGFKTLMERFHDWTIGLEVTDEKFERISNTAAFFFVKLKNLGDVVKTLWQALKVVALIALNVVNAFLQGIFASGELRKGIQGIVDSTGQLGKEMPSLSEIIRSVVGWLITNLPKILEIAFKLGQTTYEIGAGLVDLATTVLQVVGRAITDILGLIASVFPGFQSTADSVTEWLTSILGKSAEDGEKELPKWTALFGDLESTASGTVDRILKIFGYENFGKTFDDIKTRVTNAFQAVKDFFSGNTVNNDGLNDKVNETQGVLEAAFSWFSGDKVKTSVVDVDGMFPSQEEVGTKAEGFWINTFNTIKSKFGSVSLSKMFNLAKLGVLAYTLMSVNKFINSFKITVDPKKNGLFGVMDSLKTTIKNIGSPFAAFAKKITTEARADEMIKLAAAIGILSLSLMGLSMLDEQTLFNVSAVMMGLMLVLKGLSGAGNGIQIFSNNVKKVTGDVSATFDVLKNFSLKDMKAFFENISFEANVIPKTMGTLLGLATLFGVIAIVFLKIKDIKSIDEVLPALEVIGIVLGAILGLTALLALAGPRIKGLGTTFLGLSVAFGAFALTLNYLQGVDWSWNGAIGAIATVVALGLLIEATGDAISSDKMNKVSGKKLLAFGATIALLGLTFKTLGTTLALMSFAKPEGLLMAGVALGLVGLAMYGIVTAFSKVPPESSMLKAAASMVVLALALQLMLVPIAGLAILMEFVDTVAAAVITLGAFAAVMALIVVLMASIPDAENLTKAAASLLIVGLALGTMGIAIGMIADQDVDGLAAAAIALGALAAVMALILVVMSSMPHPEKLTSTAAAMVITAAAVNLFALAIAGLAVGFGAMVMLVPWDDFGAKAKKMAEAIEPIKVHLLILIGVLAAFMIGAALAGDKLGLAGLGIAGVGVGVLAVVYAFSLLPAAVQGIVDAMDILNKNVGKVVEFVLIVAAVAVAAMIATAPGFGVAIKKVLVSCADVFTQAETLAKFATAIKKIGAFLVTFLLGAMPGLIDKMIVLIVSFFMSLADAINAHATEIAIAIEKTVLALINVIVQTFVRLFFDALGWLGEMISGLLAKIPGVDTSKVTTVFDQIHDYGAGVAQKVAGLTDQAFESLDKELAEKTQQSIEKISQEAQDTLESEEPNIVNKAETVGENSAQGAINAAESTITDNSEAVVEASAAVSSKTGNTFIDTILDKISGRSSDVSDAAESTMEDAGESALSGWLTTLMDGTMLNSDALVGTGGDSSGFIMDGMMNGFSLDMPGVMETIPDEAKEYLDTKGYTLEDLGGLLSGKFTDGASAELPKGTEEYAEILVNQLDKNVESNKDKIKKIGVFASDEVRYGYLDQMVHHDASLIAGGTVSNINTEIQNKQSDITKIGTWFSEQFRIGYLAQMATDAVAMARDTVSGLSAAVNDQNSELYVIGVSLFEAIYQGYRSAADQHSPSRVMQQEMAYTIQGLVVGAEKNAKNAFNAMEAVGDGMMDAMHNSMSRLALAVDRDYDIQPKITPIVDLGPASRGASALSNMMNGGTIRSIAESYRSMEGLAISGATLNYTSQNAPVASAIDGLSKKMDRFTKSLDEDRNFNVDIRVDQMAVRDESDIRAISKQLAKEVRVALRQKGTR